MHAHTDALAHGEPMRARSRARANAMACTSARASMHARHARARTHPRRHSHRTHARPNVRMHAHACHCAHTRAQARARVCACTRRMQGALTSTPDSPAKSGPARPSTSKHSRKCCPGGSPLAFTVADHTRPDGAVLAKKHQLCERTGQEGAAHRPTAAPVTHAPSTHAGAWSQLS